MNASDYYYLTVGTILDILMCTTPILLLVTSKHKVIRILLTYICVVILILSTYTSILRLTLILLVITLIFLTKFKPRIVIQWRYLSLIASPFISMILFDTLGFLYLSGITLMIYSTIYKVIVILIYYGVFRNMKIKSDNITILKYQMTTGMFLFIQLILSVIILKGVLVYVG